MLYIINCETICEMYVILMIIVKKFLINNYRNTNNQKHWKLKMSMNDLKRVQIILKLYENYTKIILCIRN